MDRNTKSGFTIIELMIVLTVLVILVALAVPSFTGYIETQRAKGAAEALSGALYNTKAQAVKANQVTSIVIRPTTSGTIHNTWCFGMTDLGDATCDCSISPHDCAPGSVISSESYPNTSLIFTASELRSFEPLRAWANGTQGTVIFSAGQNKTLGVTLSNLGRIRVCRPAGTSISRYEDSGVCP